MGGELCRAAAASAEGGMFKTSGSLNYGLYLNSSVYGNAVSVDANTVDSARFDVFVGGDAGLNWGLRFGYESNEKGDDNESSGMDLGLSGTVAGANVWLNYVMPVTSKVGGNDQDEENADMRLGATYGMGDYTLFAEYASEGNKADEDASTSIQVGLGKSWETSNGATLFMMQVLFQLQIMTWQALDMLQTTQSCKSSFNIWC